MRRTVFDVLASAVGLVLVAVLLISGGLLMWGSSYTHKNVHDQLAQQQIFFPPKAAFASAKGGTEITPAMIPSVSQYAGQQLLTGRRPRPTPTTSSRPISRRCPTGDLFEDQHGRAGRTDEHQARGARDDLIPGHDAARAAARGLWLLEDRDDHADRLDRVVRPRAGDARVRPARLPPRPADARDEEMHLHEPSPELAGTPA